MDLTDKRWTLIEPLFNTTRRADSRGRPWRDPRVAPDYRRLVIRWGGTPTTSSPRSIPPRHSSC
jgi:hypothetical protein